MQVKSKPKQNVYQILILFECTNYSPYSLESITELAASLDAVIHGLYIEDQDLLNAVELPFVREIEYHTANVRQTNRRQMQQQLLKYSEKIKNLLQAQAGLSRVTATFSSVSGHRLSAIEQHISGAQLVLLPAYESLLSKNQNRQNLHRNSTSDYIAVVYDTSPASERCLNTAISIARVTGIELLVLSNTREIVLLLDQQDVKHTLVKTDVNQSEWVFPVLKQYVPKLLVIPASSQLLQQQHYLQQHINRFNYDVMIVR
ncbi:MAG: hypothetical protein ACN4GM_07670 [Gammaproteobacteria bacterium]